MRSFRRKRGQKAAKVAGPSSQSGAPLAHVAQVQRLVLMCHLYVPLAGTSCSCSCSGKNTTRTRHNPPQSCPQVARFRSADLQRCNSKPPVLMPLPQPLALLLEVAVQRTVVAPLSQLACHVIAWRGCSRKVQFCCCSNAPACEAKAKGVRRNARSRLCSQGSEREREREFKFDLQSRTCAFTFERRARGTLGRLLCSPRARCIALAQLAWLARRAACAACRVNGAQKPRFCAPFKLARRVSLEKI